MTTSDHDTSDPTAEWDQTLRRLFAATPPPAAAERFTAIVTTAIERHRVRRRWYQVGAAVLVAIAAAVITPYAVRASLGIASRIGEWLTIWGQALLSPPGWLAALAIAAWLLRRVRVRLQG